MSDFYGQTNAEEVYVRQKSTTWNDNWGEVEIVGEVTLQDESKVPSRNL